MIVGLKKSVPYVIKLSPETVINAKSFKIEASGYLDVLIPYDVNVRAIICDNHPSNISTFTKIT